MMKKRKLVLKVFAFICTMVVVILSAEPLYSSEADTRLLTLFFGAFGGGAMLASLILEIKKFRGSK